MRSIISRHVLLIAATVLSLCSEISLAEERIRIDRLSARLTYASHGEKVVRASASVEWPELSVVGVPEAVVQPDDGLLAQVACVNANGDRVHPQQAFVRFVRVDRETEDSVHVMAQKPIEMRADLKLIKEIRANREFWDGDAVYRVEVIVGDTRMENGGVTWVAVKELRFAGGGGKGVFAPLARGVFDFDVSAKKALLPEFSAPVAAGVKQAPRIAVAAAVAAVVGPLPLVVVAWGRLGALPLSVPGSSAAGGGLASAALFEACLLAHVAALAMFWLRWNIVQTWRAMALLMLPTVFFGHRALSAAASRHVRRQGARVAKVE